MAAFAQPNRPTSPSSRPNDNTSRRRALPEGPCNYRDLTAGPKPPGCGCRRFWWTGEVYTAQELDNVQQNTPWCVCGHHACFHDLVERFARGANIGQESSSPSLAPPRAGQTTTTPLGIQQASNGSRGVSRPLSGSTRLGLRGLDDIQPASTFSTPGRMSARHVQELNKKSNSFRESDLREQAVQPRNTTSSEVNTSVVPRIPSMCLLNSSELQPWGGYEAQPNDASLVQGAGQHPGRYDALGLVIHNGSQGGRPASPSSTVADETDLPLNESQLPLPSTREASSGDSVRNISPNTGFMQHVLAARQTQTLDVNFSRPPFMFEDLIQSATEVATPSVNNTPDFRKLEQTVQDTRSLVDIIVSQNHTSLADAKVPVNSGNNSNPHATVTTEEIQDTAALPIDPTESIQDALKRIPLTLQQLTPLLTSLHGYLARNPDISIHESINTLTRRMEFLENSSFNHIAPEQLQDQFENLDCRLIELDNRVDDHDRILTGHDPDNGRPVRKLRAANEKSSFASDHSLASATSSALISAAIDRAEAEGRLKMVEERLDDLEKVQLPSLAFPWELEVILLPWGRDLKGIWYPLTELMKPGMTQDSESPTQARSMSRNSLSLATGESGQSDEIINNWAEDDENWLSPKACGTKGVVYHRLCSRGLAKKVTLSNPGGRAISDSICNAFGDLLHTISGKGQQSPPRFDDDDVDEDSFLGLEAPFIPLRKVHKSSRLRFLSPIEMVTPALWTAEFLASGVLMRAPGGHKRLFITTRDAYLQPTGEQPSAWTWQRLRLLARVQPHDEPDQAEGVLEADAREPCWAHHPTLDPPASSVNTSFASHTSHVSNSFAEEPAQEILPAVQAVESSQHSDSESEEESEDRRAAIQPITPISEFPTQRSMQHRRTRTVSHPLTDASYSAPPQSTHLQIQSTLQNSQISKRRIRSFSHSSNPLIATLPTFIPSPSKSRSRLSKRPRLARSRSPSPSPSADDESVESSQLSITSLDPNIDPTVVLSHLRDRVPSGEAIMPIWAFTPRRSREPLSPFFVEGSDAGVGASQSTAALRERGRVDKQGRGITPSAYATPFSGTAFAKAGTENSADDGDVWQGVEEAGKAGGEQEDQDESMDDESFDGDEGDSGFSEGESDDGAAEEEDDEDEDHDMSSVDELHWEGV
jgi:hypothetical protein